MGAKIYLDCIIYSIRSTGGITVYTDELIKELNNRRANFELVDQFPSKLNKYLHRYTSCNIDAAANDIFHSSYYRVPSVPVKTVVTVHDFIYERYYSGIKKKIHSWQKFNAINKADALICVSNATKDDLLEYTGGNLRSKVYVIHNGVSEAYSYLDKFDLSNRYVLFVGKRDGYKNFKLAVDVVSRIDGVNLISVGGGGLTAEEVAYISKKKCSRKVFNFPRVTEERLNELYNGAICLLYLSSYEGFGIPVIEAMKSGCPVINIPCKAVLEVACGASLTAASYHDLDGLVELVYKCAGSSRGDFIYRGLQIAERYSWSKTHAKTIEVYANT